MSELTFKTRVSKFWNWYTQNAARFYETIEAGKCMDLAPEVGEACNHLFPGLAWVFGPGENGEGHSFTLTGEGELSKQFLTSFWLSCAPEIEGWTFYSARPASQLDPGQMIEVNGMQFGPQQIIVQPVVDDENEAINLFAWHPEFEKCDEDLRYMVLTLWLDEALGETGTQCWVGTVKMKDVSSSPKSMTMLELPAFVKSLQEQTGWTKLPPDQSYCMYKLPEPSEEFPRGDTIAGTTSNMQLIGDFLDSGGEIEDAIPGTGADFIYLTIDPSVLTEGSEVESRGRIEDALNEALSAQRSGRVFGGALGFTAAYIDLIVFDGEESVEIIHKVMESCDVDSERYGILTFAAQQEA